MLRKIAFVLALLTVVGSFGFIHHRSVGSLNVPASVSANWCSGGSGCPSPASLTCNQTPWTVLQYYTTSTASVVSPSLGSGCTRHVITGLSGTLNDSSDFGGCIQSVNLYDGNTDIWVSWLGGYETSPSLHSLVTTFPTTSYLHNNTDGTQTLVLAGVGPSTAGTATLQFGGHCPNSFESLSLTGFDE